MTVRINHFCGMIAIHDSIEGEPRHLSALRRAAFTGVRSIGIARTRTVGAYENRTARQRGEEKKAIVIHPHWIIYGVSLLSPSAGVRPRDPYSGDLTSRD